MLRNRHSHAREASAPHAHRRHDDHPVLRGPPGYGGPAGVLRACPHRTRAPRRASSLAYIFRSRGVEASSPADRRSFVPRAPRARTLTRRPRVPLTANAGPTHVQDRPDPDGARATRPDHPRPSSLRASTRDRARAASLAKTPDSISLDFPENVFFFRHRRKTRATPIRRLASTRVCLSLFARVLSPLARDSRVPNTLITTHDYDKK